MEESSSSDSSTLATPANATTRFGSFGGWWCGNDGNGKKEEEEEAQVEEEEEQERELEAQQVGNGGGSGTAQGRDATEEEKKG